ncbi:DUF389 domain-containing protein [Phototrophicus methaneseepsis]|uniref:DUF389 domain-containing protein n=1 Tax=Phototrophicus methaneseepsis TaxID=2710758 RepID=A0A7S8E6H1_9CHLR|nr:DUF389 domain-containing protein [Phototrophicus methaneseepsis]QPC81276.1 DUF389 domain-containing protein [Phototrophicus methaneseepsis]
MRQIFIQVPREHSNEAKQTIESYEPINLTQVDAEGKVGPTQMFIANVSNRKIEGLFEDLNRFPDTSVTLVPTGVYSFRLDTAQIPDQVTDIDLLSPIEVFLSGLQSIGSWKGFLGYAVAGGLLIWLGLYINSVVLLIAGMLVSPLAGPAMNLAISIARGDIMLMRHSLTRYVVAILAMVVVSAALSILIGLNIITQQMDSMSQISELAVLIPLVVGVGGALSLIQSSSSSLVSGTVSGLLVAASLGPPVDLIGIGIVLGEWDLVRTSIFVVLLQLVAINLSGTIVLRLNDLKARGGHYERGKRWLFPVGMVVTVVALAGLLLWQRTDPPKLQRASVAQEVANDIRDVFDDYTDANLIEMQTRFTRTDIQGQNSLLIVLYVQPSENTTQSDDAIQSQLRQSIQARIAEEGYHVTPLIDISVLEPPA